MKFLVYIVYRSICAISLLIAKNEEINSSNSRNRNILLSLYHDLTILKHPAFVLTWKSEIISFAWNLSHFHVHPLTVCAVYE